jgi:hypothetical protein
MVEGRQRRKQKKQLLESVTRQQLSSSLSSINLMKTTSNVIKMGNMELEN